MTDGVVALVSIGTMMKTLKSKIISAVSALACLAATYYILQQPAPGMAAWLLGLPAAGIVAATALVRGNQIPAEVTSWRSQLRRAGFLFAGLGSLSFALSPLAGMWPDWHALFFVWGIAATWLTTPNMPPWWDYMTGKKKIKFKDLA